MSAFPLSEVGSRLFNHLEPQQPHLEKQDLFNVLMMVWWLAQGTFKVFYIGRRGKKTLKYQRDTGYAIEKEPANQKMAIHRKSQNTK